MTTYTLTHSLNIGFEQVIRVIKTAADATQTPFFIAGATARDIILHHIFGRNAGRRTQDIDTAIYVSSWEEFNEMKYALIRAGLSETREIQRLRDNESGLPIDIIPFGHIADNNFDVSWPPEHWVTLSIAGFQEAFDASITVDIGYETPIRVASLAGLALLKLIAWNDRHLTTDKDASDFFTLLEQYQDIHSDRLYEDSIPGEKLDFAPFRMGAYLLGFDTKLLLNGKSFDQLQNVQTTLSERFLQQLVRLKPALLADDITTYIHDFWAGFHAQ
ncbi:nucleotidyl transferase AbiEii/AbiGii toxin family protein [Alteromonas sp. a30]|uniref:nucleotidyl transferase AbiEii/AbiGii toxin family protein n=1 Tax=Alteromonas sp. a30 TaxID=2730917 RepID=UPI00227F0581|nr:nucleotidyl transferase AbiEii/AbiGii toxin family protein [Alteromonas sp. a30]MCY7296763.1 hypothetical protein [Alteromonas sp. a30]